jgi:phospholipid transport system substrate-binding protein
LIIATFLMVAISLPGSAQETPGKDPVTLINDFHKVLVQSMQAGSVEARQTLIAPAVTHYFSVRTIARISLGQNWNTLSDTEQQSLSVQMHDLIVSTYVSRFKNYDGQQFSVMDSTPLGSNRVRIKSTLTTKKEIVSLDYQLLNSSAGWRVYDIVANGVSDLSLKRSNYGSMFKAGGLKLVQDELERNIEKNGQGYTN